VIGLFGTEAERLASPADYSAAAIRKEGGGSVELDCSAAKLFLKRVRVQQQQ